MRATHGWVRGARTRGLHWAVAVLAVGSVVACATPGTTTATETTSTTLATPTTSSSATATPTPSMPGTPTATPTPQPTDDRVTQTVRITAPDGSLLDLQGDTRITTSQTLVVEEFAASSSSGNPVEVVSLGPAGTCSEDVTTPGAAPAVFIQGSLGDSCEMVLHADGDEQFHDLDVVVEIVLEAAYVARWNTTGPGASGCVAPGSSVADIVVELTADQGLEVDIQAPFEPWLDWDLVQDEGGGRLTGIEVASTAPPGAMIRIVARAGQPGTSVGDVQPDDVFEWTVEDPCDDPVS